MKKSEMLKTPLAVLHLVQKIPIPSGGATKRNVGKMCKTFPITVMLGLKLLCPLVPGALILIADF